VPDSEKPRPPSSVRQLTLPARHYTDAALFEREMEAIHLGMWLYAGRAERIPEAGRYFVCEVAGASVIVVRDASGEVAAFHNVCRHRGTRLCAHGEGAFAGRIQCSYHGWTYGLDGRLKAAPHMEQVEGFDEADYPLRRVATAVWDGHVFVNLADEPSSFAEHLGGLDRRFAPWGMADLVGVERRRYEVAANWKLLIQNYSECLHCPIAHPLLQRHSHYLSGENDAPHPTFLGGRMDLREGVATLSLDGRTNRRPLPGLTAEDCGRVYYYALLPNLLLNLHPDYMLTFTLWPRAVDRTEVICEWSFHPDEVGRPGFDPRGAIEFWDLTNRQDWELSTLAQRGIGSRGYVPGPYSNREELLYALDRFVEVRLARKGQLSLLSRPGLK